MECKFEGRLRCAQNLLQQMQGRMWGGALLNHQHTAETTIVTLKQSLSLKIVKLGEEVMCPKLLIQGSVLHT